MTALVSRMRGDTGDKLRFTRETMAQFHTIEDVAMFSTAILHSVIHIDKGALALVEGNVLRSVSTIRKWVNLLTPQPLPQQPRPAIPSGLLEPRMGSQRLLEAHLLNQLLEQAPIESHSTPDAAINLLPRQNPAFEDLLFNQPVFKIRLWPPKPNPPTHTSRFARRKISQINGYPG